MGVAKGLSTLFFMTTCVGAGYGLWVHRAKTASDGELARTADARSQAETSLATCQRDLTAVRTKAADDAASIKSSRAELDALRAERAESERRLASLTEKFKSMIDSGKLQVTLRHGKMIVKLPAEILFPSGSAELSKEGRAAIAEVGGILKQIGDRRFEVAGYTDNVPIGPSHFKNNLELSVTRAEMVAEELIAAGMSPSRVAAAGYSAYDPVRSNATEAGRRENRRIEIVLTPNLSDLPSAPLPESPKVEAAASGAPASSAPAAP